ncbi:MAG TPA: hypothetical protein VMT20_20070 [Terriglobia bacterium]|nr:hypothetical protein [Terriglobia bacterium]
MRLAVDLTNPQSLNRYAYVMNNPTTLIDPSGLDACDQPGENADAQCVNVYGNPTNSNVPCFLMEGYDCGYGPPQQSGYPYEPPPGSSGGSGQGTAPSNKPQPKPPRPTSVGTQQAQQQACLNEYNGSAVGGAVRFFSLYNLATNFNGAWKDWIVYPAAKIGAASLTKWASQMFGNTEFWSITSPAAAPAEQIVAPAAAGIEWAEGVGGAVAPVAIIGTTAADMNIQSACAGNQPQWELAPTVL